jgi:hypothetical protein
MPEEPRTLKRDLPLGREDWITKFVNALVRELCPGLDRKTAVTAARNEWPRMQEASPYLAAKEWASRGATP